jgi:tRNA modification GTPase
VPMTIVDTAGVRESPADAIEAEGIARAAAARRVAAVVLVVLDGSMPLGDDDRALLRQTQGERRVLVANKSDLGAAWTHDEAGGNVVRVSALTGAGMEALSRAIADSVDQGGRERDVPAITNMRHVDLLGRARAALRRATEGAAAGVPEEFVLADLHEARAMLEEVTGARTTDDMLGVIFSSFCIGK